MPRTVRRAACHESLRSLIGVDFEVSKYNAKRRPPTTFYAQIIAIIALPGPLAFPVHPWEGPRHEARRFGISLTPATNNLIRINEGISNLPRQAPRTDPSSNQSNQPLDRAACYLLGFVLQTPWPTLLTPMLTSRATT